jgi:kynureninase
MSLTAADLRHDPNPLAQHYRAFRVDQRILLSGHSHQAWPDVAREGQLEAFDTAADLVDGKWARAFERAERVRRRLRHLLDDPHGRYTLAPSTHDLLIKLFSAFHWRTRPRIVTTEGEFLAARRQFARLEEEGWQIARVPSLPAADVGARLAALVDDHTAVVMLSTVFFETARIAGAIPKLVAACRRHGVALVLDIYHHVNVLPFSVRQLDLDDVFLVGGGYKYLQWGEGNAFLRFPAGCTLRPVITGWFAAFGKLTDNPQGVPFPGDDERFAGATYDPTPQFRAARVCDFFEEQGLEPELLRASLLHQIGLLQTEIDALDLPPKLLDRDRGARPEDLGGFLAVRSPRAGDLRAGLQRHGVLTDHRGDILRLGPAPYLSDRQLVEAIRILGEVARQD